MSKSLFISCVYEDSRHIDTIQNWASQQRLGSIAITKETEDKRALGKDAIKQHLKAKIQSATFIVVLIGDTTHNHDWVAAEAELANSFNKQIICIRLPGTTGAAPPILANHKPIGFNPDELKRRIEV